MSFGRKYQVTGLYSKNPVEYRLTSDAKPVPETEASGSFSCQVSAREASQIAEIHRMSLDQLTEIVQLRRRILDIGPGASSLYELIEEPSSLTAIDLFKPQDAGFETPFAWVQGFADKLPFKNRAFDFIIATNSLPMWSESNPQCERFYGEVARCLDVGGIALIASVTSYDRFQARNQMCLPSDHFIPLFDIRFKKGEAFTFEEATCVA